MDIMLQQWIISVLTKLFIWCVADVCVDIMVIRWRVNYVLVNRVFTCDCSFTVLYHVERRNTDRPDWPCWPARTITWRKLKCQWNDLPSSSHFKRFVIFHVLNECQKKTKNTKTKKCARWHIWAHNENLYVHLKDLTQCGCFSSPLQM